MQRYNKKTETPNFGSPFLLKIENSRGEDNNCQQCDGVLGVNNYQQFFSFSQQLSKIIQNSFFWGQQLPTINKNFFSFSQQLPKLSKILIVSQQFVAPESREGTLNDSPALDAIVGKEVSEPLGHPPSGD